MLSGPCSKVTCGKLVCDTPTHTAPSDAYIVDVQGTGPGCPEGSISHRIRSDRKAFIVDFSRMQLHHTPGGAPQRVGCASRVTIHVPKGWQLSAPTVTTGGYARLPAGTAADQISFYSLEGVRLDESRARLNGPYRQVYALTSTSRSAVWSSCGRNATFAMDDILELHALGNPSESAAINFGSATSHSKTVFWQWRRC
ncbi:hypothetical protein BE08_44300 [Sorangium cellulosum]|uniref:Secreted protein n=1 Tax=Sorangium cellulosum TaxID=56 RepID=A0A150PV23_SORCE|nr:hypothetical protein BE08_44300 [Sorangium cellulosum]